MFNNLTDFETGLHVFFYYTMKNGVNELTAGKKKSFKSFKTDHFFEHM